MEITIKIFGWWASIAIVTGAGRVEEESEKAEEQGNARIKLGFGFTSLS